MTRGFDVVIIDEAMQAVEPTTLVPLVHGCRQVFLVGDPVQLPATVISSTAQELGYGTSLFKRFQAAGFPVQMLKIQYRMHLEIASRCQFI
ncbi:probable helicase MAGATAMA 3 [Aegilops tauschii subsp. strangulata]|uniref:probable helicase MAGATAMA 3 n=1 Tax=Triticum aestivum TaxID=4565 RepID=UPI001D00D186|nr:probable helicase MAGATAMA 3 [Triticum aestivum]XP_045089015.1 probable helicase MAGATAMA 3 [Aegilops tauschii subsp. strangulata]